MVNDYFIKLGYTFTKYGDEFSVKVKDLPLNAHDKVLVVCDSCGNTNTIDYYRYNETIKKYGNYLCQHCVSERTLNDRQGNIYIKILEFCNQHGYELLTKKEDILTRQSEIKYVCPKHGLHTTKATNILQGKLCYQCSRENASNKKWDHSAIDRMKNYYYIALETCKKLGYKLLSKEDEIKTYNTYIKYECPIHGEHKMKYSNLISGRHCPECGHPKSTSIKNVTKDKTPKNKLSIDEIIRRIEICGGFILNPLDYKNQYERNLNIICPGCGLPFTTSLILFTQHGGLVCHDCYRKESTGERKIRQYLERKNIKFAPEYWFDDCRDIKPLPFDFYLCELNTIIEFDGKQHFYDGKKFFHKSYDYEKAKKHDDIKNKYCKDHNIKIIRIPYWNIENIDTILDEELNYLHDDIV